MKKSAKSPKKLKLSKETLRGLEAGRPGDLRLRQVVGAVSGTCHNISGCPRC